jgi:hypothetical protein
LREAGLDPDAIMANAPAAAAVSVNGLPTRIPQMPQHQQHSQTAKLQGDGGNVTPPNALSLPDQGATHMLASVLTSPRDAST